MAPQQDKEAETSVLTLTHFILILAKLTVTPGRSTPPAERSSAKISRVMSSLLS